MSKIKLRIHTWPEAILQKRCKRLEKVDDNARKLLYDMLALMRVGGGAGLAANQAGLDLSLVVIEVGNNIFKLVNPRIVKREGRIIFREGCLSFPGLELDIKRSNKVWVEALDEKGEPFKIEAEGVLAVVFQHEIDHIEGVTFIKRIPFWKRLLVSGKLNKIKRRTMYGLRKQRKK